MITRGGKKEFFEDIEFLEKANQKYLEIAEIFKSERNIYIIDANGTIETVTQQVEDILNTYF